MALCDKVRSYYDMDTTVPPWTTPVLITAQQCCFARDLEQYRPINTLLGNRFVSPSSRKISSSLDYPIACQVFPAHC